jgi:hypothetical protein
MKNATIPYLLKKNEQHFIMKKLNLKYKIGYNLTPT